MARALVGLVGIDIEPQHLHVDELRHQLLPAFAQHLQLGRIAGHERIAHDAVHGAHVARGQRLPALPEADELGAFRGRKGFLHGSAAAAGPPQGGPRLPSGVELQERSE